jgi:hypothetical protein
MATNSSFDALLKRYMPYELLVEEMKRKSYFWNKVEKDQSWNGGVLEVPFEGGEASSLSLGSLTSSTDVAEHTEVMGTLSVQPELWGTMLFNEKDLDRHDGDMEASYLKIVPGKIDQFVTRMQERVSLMLLGDGSIAKATGNGLAGGTIAVDRPQVFSIGEKVEVIDNDTAAVAGYVTAINVQSGVLTIKTARSSGSAVDLSTYTTAQSARVQLPGATSNGFTSLKSQLLLSANGGASTLFGQTKLSYPFLQAINIDGSGFTAATILDDLLGAYYIYANLAKGNATEILVSFGMMKNIAKQLETNRRFVTTDKKAGYGFRSIEVMGPDGVITITALRDVQSDYAAIMDWGAVKFHGSKFFERKRHLNGEESFLVRNTTGYQYLVDLKFYGDLVVNKPSHCGIIYGIPSTVSA